MPAMTMTHYDKCVKINKDARVRLTAKVGKK